MSHSDPHENAKQVVRLCAMSPAERRIELVRAWAGQAGYTLDPVEGQVRNATGKAVAAGWDTFAGKKAYFNAALTWVMADAVSAFGSMDTLLDAAGSYFPTLRPDTDWRLLAVADEYDRRQEARGDDRRAFLGGFRRQFNGIYFWEGNYPTPEGWRNVRDFAMTEAA